MHTRAQAPCAILLSPTHPHLIELPDSLIQARLNEAHSAGSGMLRACMLRMYDNWLIGGLIETEKLITEH